jgi:glycosyltransferase involved in cell wall biosynthesis
MVIAINTRVLSGNSAISKLLIDCFEMTAVNHPEHIFIFIAEKQFAEKGNGLQNVKRIVLPQQSSNPLLWKLWYNYKLHFLLKKIKASILISADGVCSLRTKVPQCLVINDFAFLHYPEWYSKKYFRFIKSNTIDFLQKAKTVVTFSDVLKNEIVNRYSIGENKVTVVSPTSGKKYQPVSLETKERVKEKYTEGKEYFLFNGYVHPRSSLVNLLKAFSLFKKRQKSNMQLIIASQNISEDVAFVESLKLYKYRNEVKLLTSLDEKLLTEITASAYVCINTSPLHNEIVLLLNAMECEVPVIAGNLKVAIEILGDAPLLVNSDMPENIAEKLMLLYKDENKRNELVKKGLEQSAKFSLNETAGKLWQNILTTIQPS